MDWIFISLQWYSILFILGLIFYPLITKIFGKVFIDNGYAFSKTLAILFVSYSIFFLGILKILPFTQFSLIIVIALFTVINIFIWKKNKHSVTDLQHGTIFLIVFEEILFFAALIFWVFVRGQEPSVRGLEKFMDFGFMNSILRTKFFPPLDMWLSADQLKPNGYPINYYYFGHLTGAVLMKISGVKPAIGYNLILATVFALAISQTFSLIVGIIYNFSKKVDLKKFIFYGLLGSYIVNLGGNLHTIYTFTTGYPNDNPIPFWQILSWFNPTKYWYPNATRFIAFTIHEFPSYSWVVADLHGHVFDIPFVLLTLAILFIFFIKNKRLKNKNYFVTPIFLGFLTAVHYMTNAFDGPIYLLLSSVLFFIILGWGKELLISLAIMFFSFIAFALPFSIHFSPFVTGIGVNCSANFLVNLKKLGPFLFEKDKCQISPIWMLFVLWGFFWVNFIIFLIIKIKKNGIRNKIDDFFLILFSLGTIFIIIPEFFYIKDIYPQHFRANTMFKLGYQAFIMMSIASTYTFYKIKLLEKPKSIIFSLVFVFFFFFVAIYPFFSTPSYYGNLNREVQLDGSKWLQTFSLEDSEIVDYLNQYVKGQPVILEAQGDSYTDFNVISAYTGLPTVAGWWVHEWLWRGSPDIVGKRIPDIVNIYESPDLKLTKDLLKKYHVKYVIVSKLERQKYQNLKEDKFAVLGKLIFRSSNGIGSVYQVN